MDITKLIVTDRSNEATYYSGAQKIISDKTKTSECFLQWQGGRYRQRATGGDNEVLKEVSEIIFQALCVDCITAKRPGSSMRSI